MKTFSIIGIDPIQYEEIKFNAFMDWINNNTTTAIDCQMCLLDKGLKNYFIRMLSSIEMNFIFHLQSFKKPLNGQERLNLYHEHLKRFNHIFPKALKPKIKNRPSTKYEYN